jgi:transcriptional regulator
MKRNIEDAYIPETPHTGRNALKFALKTLSSVSSNIPFGSVLSSVIDPLFDIADRIEVRMIAVITQLISICIPANIGQRTRSC